MTQPLTDTSHPQPPLRVVRVWVTGVDPGGDPRLRLEYDVCSPDGTFRGRWMRGADLNPWLAGYFAPFTDDQLQAIWDQLARLPMGDGGRYLEIKAPAPAEPEPPVPEIHDYSWEGDT